MELAGQLLGARRPTVTLGATTFDQSMTEALYNALIEQDRESSRAAFLLEWSGERVPFGANVGGQHIGWTQHNMVRNEAGENIGTYVRLLDTQDQKMLIFLR
jgi:hypothetical protein